MKIETITTAIATVSIDELVRNVLSNMTDIILDIREDSLECRKESVAILNCALLALDSEKPSEIYRLLTEGLGHICAEEGDWHLLRVVNSFGQTICEVKDIDFE
jgi:hypothetical protein